MFRPHQSVASRYHLPTDLEPTYNQNLLNLQSIAGSIRHDEVEASEITKKEFKLSSENPSGHIRSTCWATSVRNWDRNFDRKPVIFETLAPFRDLPDVFAVRHRLVADIRATGKPGSKPVRRSARSIRHGISGIARKTHRRLSGEKSSECGRQVAPVAGPSRCRIAQ